MEITFVAQNEQAKSQPCCEMNGIQCKLARVALDWGVRKLAIAARVSTQTISRLEAGEQLRPATVLRIRNVLEEAGVEFIADDDSESFGIRIRKPRS